MSIHRAVTLAAVGFGCAVPCPLSSVLAMIIERAGARPPTPQRLLMKPPTAGYSGKPLYQKLGLKPGMRCLVLGAPDHYQALIEGAEGVRVMKRARSADVVHLFCHKRADLSRRINSALDRTIPGGMVWVSWPKKSSPLFIDLTENDIRSQVLPTGWVDVKVCAVDQDWSGLKFLRRRQS